MKITCCMQAGHGGISSQDRLLAFDTILANGDFCWETAEAQSGCIAIFDGVGGVAGGAYAAGYAAQTMALYAIAENNPPLSVLLQNINEHLKRSGGYATTASGLLWNDGRCILFHTGNTRVWVSNGRYLEQITEDQTYVHENAGNISQEEYERSSHIITGCLGGEGSAHDKLVVEDVRAKVAAADKILLTCDGVHEYLDAYDLETIIYRGGTLQEIVRAARDNGSEDDCSIMLIERKL